jgi:diguanylate cyclase (GGDEF)-like protein
MMMASTLECLILSLPVAGRIRHLRVEHERAQERHVVLERQAQTDSLTGLANRRGFDEALTRAAAAQADPTPMAVLLIDIDHFKRVNDRYGHAAGDAILQHVASHVAKVAGAGAIVSRFGGEEFVVALRGYDLARAGTIAERIRKSVGVMLDATAKLPQVTVSIGVAAGHSAAMDAMLADADCALYRAKNEGRDRVIVADGPLMYAAAA